MLCLVNNELRSNYSHCKLNRIEQQNVVNVAIYIWRHKTRVVDNIVLVNVSMRRMNRAREYLLVEREL